MSDRSQLERLARPFPSQYVTPPAPGKYGSYVSHDVVNQALLAIVGPFSWSAGDWVENDQGQIEGCTGRLTLCVDGRTVVIEEPGDCEQPGNWKTQGARMKDAASDAFKRCAMRAGLGLHLWNKSGYFLYDQLRKDARPEPQGEHPAASADDTPSPTPGVSSAPPLTADDIDNMKPPALTRRLLELCVERGEEAAASLPAQRAQLKRLVGV